MNTTRGSGWSLDFDNLPFGFLADEKLDGGYCSEVWANETRVLKVPWRGEELVFGLTAALRLQHAGGPRVHAWDVASGALIMDRVRPGTPLSDSPLSVEQQLEVFCDVVKRMSGLDTEGLMPLTDFVIDHPVAESLHRTTEQPGFLHGDLHHGNLLEAQNGQFVVIDAKGLVGDPAFEAAAFLRNPLSLSAEREFLVDLTRSRLKTLHQRFGWSPYRMVAWSWLTLIQDRDERPPDSLWHEFESIFLDLMRELG